MPQARDCPKCGGAMAEGFTLDKIQGGVAAASWVEGTPEKSFWTGLKLKGRARLDIATWRCRRCGYLESYAPDA
ncbi:MAG: hypothetical protein JOZ90_08970 [Alphaproteobacteria bacterium]|nr:hypothetical protein [Alphaproteobacteria bacterium]MBV9371140.1 hypothetical protein [Alphaproteobacteria bacterium]MBV9901215.1 hypothetical protein [Alphaproteobacteria bacterium]